MALQNFRPLPMRITQKQYERLHAARDNDHLAIQEHVRRALDYYLDYLDAKGSIKVVGAAPPPADSSRPRPLDGSGDKPLPPQAPASIQPGSVSKRKLVYR